jgi:serine/threonine protein kinase/Tfp pilus assembly protein PilF
MIGQTLSHYRIVEKIGAGGMGEVYKAHDERLDRDVAVKVLPSGTLADEQARKRFRKEALALSKLNHPNIATVHDFDTQEGVDFIVMEYVEGASLAEKVKTGPLPEKEISELGAQIADALEEAHEHGIVHRDLKPGNIAVTPKGRVKVLDFGLARMLRPVSDEATTEGLTQEQAVAGTLPYMSPEELRGERGDHRSDLYSFGVVLYEMATGRRPFEEKISTALTAAIVQQPPEPPSTHNRKVPPGLESIILKALDKDPNHRYQSAREMRVDLERLSDPVSVAYTKRKPVRTARWLWAAASIAAVIAILLALSISGFWERLTSGPSTPLIDSIAVLPLENLSEDPEQEYFADGMTEALIADLAKIEALKVISRTSAMHYKGTDKPLPEIARELNVDGIIEGSVLRAEGRVRITAQLIESATDQHIWVETYERDLRDVLSLQSEVARSIAQEIKVTLTPRENALLTRERPVDPEAYETYLKGRYYFERGPPNFNRASGYYHQAIEKDPDHALAHVGLADVYAWSGLWGLATPREAMPKAKAAALKALELNETLADAHRVLGTIGLLYDWEWSTAEAELKRAIELDPNNADAHGEYAQYLSAVGRQAEAIVEAQRSVELDPLAPAINATLGFILQLSRRYDESIILCQKMRELDPNDFWTHGLLHSAFQAKGMWAEAWAEQRSQFLLFGNREVVEVGDRAFAESGYHAAMRAVGRELEEQSKQRSTPPGRIAWTFGYAGESDEALHWLERAFESRDPFLPFLRVLPEWDPLHSDPRFQDLVRRMNFPEQ